MFVKVQQSFSGTPLRWHASPDGRNRLDCHVRMQCGVAASSWPVVLLPCTYYASGYPGSTASWWSTRKKLEHIEPFQGSPACTRTTSACIGGTMLWQTIEMVSLPTASTSCIMRNGLQWRHSANHGNGHPGSGAGGPHPPAHYLTTYLLVVEMSLCTSGMLCAPLNAAILMPSSC